MKFNARASAVASKAIEKEAAAICFIDLTADEGVDKAVTSTQGSTQFNRHRIFYNTKRENGFGLPSKHILLQKESSVVAVKMFSEVFGGLEDFPQFQSLKQCPLLKAFLKGIHVRFHNCCVLRFLARHCPMASSKVKRNKNAIVGIKSVALDNRLTNSNSDDHQHSKKKKARRRMKEKLHSISGVHDTACCKHGKTKTFFFDDDRGHQIPILIPTSDKINSLYILKYFGESLHVSDCISSFLKNKEIEDSKNNKDNNENNKNVENEKNDDDTKNKTSFKKTKRGCRGGRSKQQQVEKSYFHNQASKKFKRSENIYSVVPGSSNSGSLENVLGADHAKVVTFAKNDAEGGGALTKRIRPNNHCHDEVSVIDDDVQEEVAPKNIPCYHSFRLQSALSCSSDTFTKSAPRISDSINVAAHVLQCASTSPLNRTSPKSFLGPKSPIGTKSPLGTVTVGDRLVARMRSNVAKDITLRTKRSRNLITAQSSSSSPTSRGYISQDDTIRKSLKRSTRSATSTTGTKHTRHTPLQDPNDNVISRTTKSSGIFIDLTLNKFEYDERSYGSNEKKDSLKERMSENDMKSTRCFSDVRTTSDSAVETDHCQSEIQGQGQGQGQGQNYSQGQGHYIGDPSMTIPTQSECNTEITESVCTVMWLQGMDAATNSRAMRSGLSHHVNSRTYSTQVSTLLAENHVYSQNSSGLVVIELSRYCII